MLRLHGSRVYLQEFSEENLGDPRYRAWLRDLDVVRTIYRLEYLLPLPPEEIVAYVRRLLGSKDDAFFALYTRVDDRFVGTVRLGHIDWRAGHGDVGILIGDRGAWGKGHATDAVRTLARYAFGELGLRRVTGGTPATNEAMRRCFLRLGFREEGRLRQQLLIGGQPVDHVLFGLLRGELVDEATA